MTKGWTGFTVLLALLSQAHGQEIWRQIDDQGHIRYADRPFPGAVRVEPPGITGWLACADSPSESPSAQDESEVATAVTVPTLKIAYPAADETVWGAGGELEVRLTVGGDLAGGARLSVRLDGAEAAWQGEPPIVRLKGVWRGEHRLEARLVDAEGRELAVSEEVRFFKREPAISATRAR